MPGRRPGPAGEDSIIIGMLTDAVLTIAGFQLLLLAAVLLTRPGLGGPRRNLLAAFLLTKAFLMLRWFLYRHGILTYEGSLYFFRMSAAGFFLLAPFLYLHVRALCFRDFRLGGRHLLHLLPAASVALLGAITVRILSRSKLGWITV